MRACGILLFMILISVALPAGAGISVTSYDTQAQANAYAPLDQSAYYSDDSKHNVSPAVGDVVGDWSGTNVGGSDITWHMTAVAHASSTTTIAPDSLTITGASSFSYEIATTAGFSEPLQHATLYTPGCNSGVGAYFTIDQPATYFISATLNGNSGILFASFTDGYILNQTHIGSIPKVISMSGILGPGQYQVGTGANNGGPSGLSDGVHQITRNGSVPDFVFTLQTPEPSSGILALACPVILCFRTKPNRRVSRRQSDSG